MGMEMRMSMGLSQRLETKQSLSLEQRLALKLKQELKLKMSLEQVMKLVQKLWPQLYLSMGPRFESHLTQLLKHDSDVRQFLPQYLQQNPTAIELQKEFPQMAPLFNQYYKSSPNYGSHLRQGHIGPTLSMRMTQSMRMAQTMTKMSTNWSLVEAYITDKDKGCKFPKKAIDGIDKLSLEERLKRVDEANELFHFSYTTQKKKCYKIPLLRNMNVNPEDIAIPINKAEYTQATAILEQAGAVQRIVRAVPYSEIRQTLIDHVETAGYDLDDVVVVGVDRGGRLPTGIVRLALGKEKAYFLKVDQSGRQIDDARVQKFIDDETFKGKYVLFVDSTVDSGRQISVLRSYFDDEDIQKDLKHKGWVVVGSNEYGTSLENHVNINWGLDPDQSFEDDPNLLGVDYAGKSNQVKACPTAMSTFLRAALFEVPQGMVLDTSAIAASKSRKNSNTSKVKPAESEQKALGKDEPVESKTPTLLVIGNGKEVTITEDDARYLALKIEGRYHVVAGTALGNPGYVLEQVHQYKDGKGTTLFQPEYQRGNKNTNGFAVRYVGTDKDMFRDAMIGSSDIVVALGGNEGTWTEIQKSLVQGKQIFVLAGEGLVAHRISELEGNSNLIIGATMQDIVEKLREYR